MVTINKKKKKKKKKKETKNKQRKKKKKKKKQTTKNKTKTHTISLERKNRIWFDMCIVEIMSNQCKTLEHFCSAHTWNRPDSTGKIGSVRYNNLFYCYSFCENILKYLSRMTHVSLRTAERSMFLPVCSVFDASGLCKCSIKVPFVV